jgi:hypothetical protein
MSEAAPALEAPAELWVSPGEGEYAGLWVQDGPGVDDEVRYVRADLYEALMARLAVVRSWNEAPCLEPLEAIQQWQRLQR